jgi:hypothetical protein
MLAASKWAAKQITCCLLPENIYWRRWRDYGIKRADDSL